MVTSQSKPSMYSVLIGFDYGTKNIGMAVGQMITRTATPLKTVRSKSGKPNWDFINAAIKQWRPNALVVGVPLNMDGSDQNITELAKDFMQQLQEKTNLPVHAVDERLTTREAKQQVFEQGGYRALQKADIDCLAAQLLLEQWMNNNSK